MANPATSFWAPGSIVRFGSLNFVVSANGELRRYEASPPLVPADCEFVGMAGHASESFFDLLDQGSEEDSGAESCGENPHPSRECLMVQAVAAEERDAAGPSRPPVGAPGNAPVPRASTAPLRGSERERLQARQQELEEARQQLAAEEAAIKRELARPPAAAPARARARDVYRRIERDDLGQPRFARAGQNIAAAAALLETLPEPVTPEAQ